MTGRTIPVVVGPVAWLLHGFEKAKGPAEKAGR